MFSTFGKSVNSSRAGWFSPSTSVTCGRVVPQTNSVSETNMAIQSSDLRKKITVGTSVNTMMRRISIERK